MQVIFFFLFFAGVIAFLPYPVWVEGAFDMEKMRGGLRVRLFGRFAIFRAAAIVEGKVLKIFTKKERYIFVEIVEAVSRLLTKPPEKVQLPVKARDLTDIDVVVEQGDLENIELTMTTGGLVNALGGSLFAVVKNVSPDTNINVLHDCTDSKNFRIYFKSIITVRPADIIFGAIKHYIRKGKNESNRTNLGLRTQ